MSTDPQQVAKEAYIAYITEKGFAPKNASQLINFSKFHKPPFIGVKYSSAKKVVSNPPIIDNKQSKSMNTDTTASKSASKPYLDTSITNKFVSVKEMPTKSKLTNAYDSYKQKMGKEPNNVIQFHQFCEQNSLKCTYAECALYIKHTKPSQTSKVRTLSQSLLNRNISLNSQSKNVNYKPFISGDPNAKKIKTVFQALNELQDIHDEKRDEKNELIKHTNSASFVKIGNKEEIQNNLNEYLEKKMKIKNKINVSSPQEIISTHSYHDDRYGNHVKITPISPDPILSLQLDFNYNEWDINKQNQFIKDLALELNINPSQLTPICISSGSVKFIIQICNIIKEQFPLIEKKCITLKENTNKICTKWKLKACKLKNWASNKLGLTNEISKPQQTNTIINSTQCSRLDTAETWLLNQAELLRNQIIESLQNCPQEFEISGICALDNDKCLNEFIQIIDWKNSKLLFHGTKLQHLSSIYQNGFDDKFIGSATDPGWFGRGHYFSSYPQYCMMYCEPNSFGQRT
eukprot:328145_1